MKDLKQNLTIVYSDIARNSLYEIISYFELYTDTMVQHKYLKEINKSLDLIRTFPKIEEVVLLRHNHEYRIFRIMSYIFLYYVDEENKEIVISMIFHKSMNYYNNLGMGVNQHRIKELVLQYTHSI